VRFEVNRVLDTVEQRLTTDVTLAQAVVDLADVARFEELDRGRPINLLRVGMALDALAQYLLDGAAMLYAVAGRELLSDGSLTSKERMVLGRWIDDSRIEATPMVGDRVVEIADFTGMPVVACRDYGQFVDRFPWVRSAPERLLRLVSKPGKAMLTPWEPAGSGAGGAPAGGSAAEAARAGGRGVAKIAAPGHSAAPAAEVGARVFMTRYTPLTRVSTRAIEPAAAPSSMGATMLARCWRCAELECPSFGEHRREGQPVPRMLKGVPVCPRHAQPLKDVGPRLAEYPVAVVIDDVVRRRFPVTMAHPVHVGQAPGDTDDIPLKLWLHEGAAGWIAERHARLEIVDGALTVTNLGENGTVVWRRGGPGEAGSSLRLEEGQSYRLAPHDSLELYTGIELVPGNRRVVGGPVSPPDVRSVLADAPTVALRARTS
jgi:hypothetical protein